MKSTKRAQTEVTEAEAEEPPAVGAATADRKAAQVDPLPRLEIHRVGSHRCIVFIVYIALL